MISFTGSHISSIPNALYGKSTFSAGVNELSVLSRPSPVNDAMEMAVSKQRSILWQTNDAITLFENNEAFITIKQANQRRNFL